MSSNRYNVELLKKAYEGDADSLAELYTHRETLLDEERSALSKAFVKQGANHNRKNEYFAAKVMFEHAIDLNDTDAMVCRAHMYQKGQGETDGRPNIPEAVKLYNDAMKLGNSSSMLFRGIIYQEEHDYINAARCYRDAILQENEDKQAGKTRNYSVAEDAIKRVKKLLKHIRDLKIRQECFLAMAESNDSQVNFDEAINILIETRPLELLAFQIYLRHVKPDYSEYKEAMLLLGNTIVDLAAENKIPFLELPTQLLVAHDAYTAAWRYETLSELDRGDGSAQKAYSTKRLKVEDYSADLFKYIKHDLVDKLKIIQQSYESLQKFNDLPNSLKRIQKAVKVSVDGTPKGILKSAERICLFLAAGLSSKNEKEIIQCKAIINDFPKFQLDNIFIYGCK